jgi:hypothetical protein
VGSPTLKRNKVLFFSILTIRPYLFARIHEHFVTAGAKDDLDWDINILNFGHEHFLMNIDTLEQI